MVSQPAVEGQSSQGIQTSNSSPLVDITPRVEQPVVRFEPGWGSNSFWEPAEPYGVWVESELVESKANDKDAELLDGLGGRGTGMNSIPLEQLHVRLLMKYMIMIRSLYHQLDIQWSLATHPSILQLIQWLL